MQSLREVLAAVRRDPRYLRNLDWGVPRPGHPEGTIRRHIADLERNLDPLRPKLTPDEIARLEILIHVHDIMKPEAAEGVAIANPESHASKARAFLADFCDDAELLTQVQLHDEPLALWHQARGHRRLDPGRWDALLAAIHDWDTFLAFQIIDGCTPGKADAHIRWFFERIAGERSTRITAGDILVPEN